MSAQFLHQLLAQAKGYSRNQPVKKEMQHKSSKGTKPNKLYEMKLPCKAFNHSILHKYHMLEIKAVNKVVLVHQRISQQTNQTSSIESESLSNLSSLVPINLQPL